MAVKHTVMRFIHLRDSLLEPSLLDLFSVMLLFLSKTLKIQFMQLV